MNRQLPTILYVLAFALLLPLELLIWGNALDSVLADTYLSRRLQLNLLTDLPGWLIYVSGTAAFCGMVCGLVCRRNGCSRYDALLYGSFPLYMLMLFLHFRLFCAVALGIPLICLGTAGCWFAYRTPGRTPFLPPSDLTRRALWTERLSCLWLLLAVQFCGCLLLQEGYSLWAVSPKQGVFALLPFAGILLPKPGQLRDYVLGSVCALFCIGTVYGVGQLLIQDILQQLDFSVAMTWLFWELECALLLRPLLPKVRNSSLLILGLSTCSTPWIMPQVCSPWFIVLSMYVIYLFLDNCRAIRKKIFSRSHFRRPGVHFLSWEEYAAQAWGAGAFLTCLLVRPHETKTVLAGIGAVLIAALLRTRQLSRASEPHVILRNFPYLPETAALILSVLFLASSRASVMSVFSAYACAACLILMIWNAGALIGKFMPERPLALAFQALGYGGLGFLLLLLFFFRAPTSLLLGLFLLLTGMIRIGAASFQHHTGCLQLTLGWGLAALGQLISVTSPEFRLYPPEWNPAAPVCAVMACAALYFFRTFDFRNRKERNF